MSQYLISRRYAQALLATVASVEAKKDQQAIACGLTSADWSAIAKTLQEPLVEPLSFGKQIQYELFGWVTWVEERSAAVLALTTPVLPPAEKLNLLSTLLQKNQTSTTLGKFLKLCLAKNRFGILPKIYEQLTALLDEQQEVVRGQVYTAWPLTQATKDTLTKKLAQQLKQKPSLTWHEDTKLLGGFVIQVGHRVWDGSIQTQLKQLGETIRKGVR